MFGPKRSGTTNVAVAVGATKQMRLTRLGRELRLTDQILSNDLDTVSIVQDGPAPAWTDMEGDHVSFALAKMPFPDSRLHLAVWLGTNAHELGHVLFTPRTDSPLIQRVLEGERTFMRGIANLHNIVEDQRQERLVLARFSPWRGYLTAALGHHLTGESDYSWLLMAGRTWLPDEVRAAARARFAATQGEWMATQVSDLVGDYQRLTDPGETEADAAWEVLDRLFDLLGQKVPPVSHRCSEIGGHGEPDTSAPGQSAPPTADESDPTPGGEGDDSSDDAADSDADASDGDDAGASSSADRGQGAGNGASNSESDDGSPPSLKDQLSSAAERQIAADAEASDDLNSVLDALQHGRPGDRAQGDEPTGDFIPASDRARRLHYEVADALLDLKDDSEPGWVRRTDSGRLNVRRLINPTTDADEMFDRYEAGQMDASEMDVVLLLDVSSSMARHVRTLSEVTYAIRRAVDDLDGRMTVITWDNGPHRIVAAAGDRPDDRMFVPNASGGTDPTSALRETYSVLAGSDATNRLCVILTDGDWYSNAPDKIVDVLNADGIVTVLAHFGDLGTTAVERPDGTFDRIERPLDTHRCRYARQIDDLTELARMFRDVAAERIGSWL
jgi:hypothetical protein